MGNSVFIPRRRGAGTEVTSTYISHGPLHKEGQNAAHKCSPTADLQKGGAGIKLVGPYHVVKNRGQIRGAYVLTIIQ